MLYEVITIGRLVLRDMLEQREEEKLGPDSVQLMTLHASKGLEVSYNCV